MKHGENRANPKLAPPKPECLNCHFFYETGTKESPSGVQTIGYCRANPPTPFFAEGGRAEIGRFPIVLGTLWCGLFERKIS